MEPQNQSHEPEHDVLIEEKKKPLISTPAAILTGAVIIALAIIFVFKPASSTKITEPVPTSKSETPTSVPEEIATVRRGDHIKGDAQKADVILIEYSDSDCSFCARFHPVVQQVVDEYKGRVAWIYRHFPLTTIHPNAYTEALALECSAQLGGNGAFWKYLDTIMNVTLTPDPTSNKTLVTFATAQGIDATAFQQCIANPNTAKPIDANIAEVESVGAQGTPFSIIVNQKTGAQVVIPGAYPIEEVRKSIDSIL